MPVAPILLSLCLLAAPDGRPAQARSRLTEAERIRRIGRVVVLLPPCDGLPCRPIHPPERVREWLEPLVGDPFDARRVLRRVERHYEYLGYRPRIHAAFSEGVLDVEVLEARAAVAGVTVDPALLAPHVPESLLDDLPPIDRPHVPAACVRTRPGDLVNRERLAQDEYDLALLGYDIVPLPDGGAAGEAGTGGDAAAASEAESSGGRQDASLPPRRFVIARRPPRREWREARSAGDPLVEPLRKSWISGSAEYSRRQLFTARLYYQRSHLFREFDLVELSPYVARRLAGAITYRLPYILPASITRMNLFAEARIYDEFTPDRLLDGVETDEERAGGRLALGLEPFRRLDGHSLKGWAYVNRYHLSFGRFAIPVNGGIVPRSGRVPGGSLNDVNVLGVGLDYAYEHHFRAPRLSWRFLPSAEVATKAWGGDIAFRRVAGELQQHYAFSTGFEIDTRWKAGLVDRRVPVFEQFSLGGADSLRGFLRDDFLGRRFLTAQHDVWIPIPFRAFGRDSDLLAALQRNLKTALTLDVGSVSFEQTRDVRFARGIGLGLRWSAETSPLVVRLDAAYGHWRGESRWYPYLSFSRRW